MLELAQTLVLNEEVLNSLSDKKRARFLYEWLLFLEKVLKVAKKEDIKHCQATIIAQLIERIGEGQGPAIRALISKCAASIFVVGDTLSLFYAIEGCHKILRRKEDLAKTLNAKLGALLTLGTLYIQLGRLVGRSFEETLSLCLKLLKSSEAQLRAQIFLCLSNVLQGLGSAGASIHREIYKVSRSSLNDRSMEVRYAVVKCFTSLAEFCVFMRATPADIENNMNIFVRIMDSSSFPVKIAIADLIAHLLKTFFFENANEKSPSSQSKQRKILAEDVFLSLLNCLPKYKGFRLHESAKFSLSHNKGIWCGIALSFVAVSRSFGKSWIEKNLSLFINSTLELAYCQKLSPLHFDAIYYRKCTRYVLRSVLGSMLGEKIQINAARELCYLVVKLATSIDITHSNEKNVADFGAQNMLICVLEELASLLLNVSNSANILVKDSSLGFVSAIQTSVVVPCSSVSLAAAWCFRCLAVSLPSVSSKLIALCLEKIVHYKHMPYALKGYGFSLLALTSTLRFSSLGIPYNMNKEVFDLAEDMLQTANQQPNLSLIKIEIGWYIISAFCTLGDNIVKMYLSRLYALWKYSFPRSMKDLEIEKSRGDCFTWKATILSRAGALASMESLLCYSSDTVLKDVMENIVQPIEYTVAYLPILHDASKFYGTALSNVTDLLKIRLYRLITKVPLTFYEEKLLKFGPSLLKEGVADFTSTANSVITSLVEESIQTKSAVSNEIKGVGRDPVEHELKSSNIGTLEFDPLALIWWQPNTDLPTPFNSDLSLIDSAIQLCGTCFQYLSTKQKIQTISYFAEVIDKLESREVTHTNIIVAILLCLKNPSKLKIDLLSMDLRKKLCDLVLKCTSSQFELVRFTAAECLGRLAQIVTESNFVVDYSLQKIKECRDVASRTGFAYAIGCIHRLAGVTVNKKLFNNSISVLLALSEDTASAVVQTWAIRSISMLADSSGPMFRSYVEASLKLLFQLSFSTPMNCVELFQSIGCLLTALIASVGPELQETSPSVPVIKLDFSALCHILASHKDSSVCSFAIYCLQELHLFDPKYFNLTTTVVPQLCVALRSPDVIMRSASVSCLRQLCQREAPEVSEQAEKYIMDNRSLYQCDTLEEILFVMLDVEHLPKLLSNIKDTLTFLLNALYTVNLCRWIELTKTILSASSGFNNPSANLTGDDEVEDDEQNDLTDDTKFTTHSKDEIATLKSGVKSPRWPSRLFAADCVLKIIKSCSNDVIHFDLSSARKTKENNSSKGRCLAFYLSDLIRMSFILSTSESDTLKIAGLTILQIILDKFSHTYEPEFPDHLLLEQYQAQVTSALRTAFDCQAFPKVTAHACDVSVAWMCSEISKDLNYIRPVYNLLLAALRKLSSPLSPDEYIYSEVVFTLQQLAVLRAWSEIYIFASNENVDYKKDLLALIRPELDRLIHYWLCALVDYSQLALSAENEYTASTIIGWFYVPEMAEQFFDVYLEYWTSILRGACLFLASHDFVVNELEDDDKLTGNFSPDHGCISPPDSKCCTLPSKEDKFFLVIGIALQALLRPSVHDNQQEVLPVLYSLTCVLSCNFAKEVVDDSLSLEIASVLMRTFVILDDQIKLQVEVVKTATVLSNSRLSKDFNEQFSKIIVHLLLQALRKITSSDSDLTAELMKSTALLYEKTFAYCCKDLCFLESVFTEITEALMKAITSVYCAESFDTSPRFQKFLSVTNALRVVISFNTTDTIFTQRMRDLIVLIIDLRSEGFDKKMNECYHILLLGVLLNNYSRIEEDSYLLHRIASVLISAIHSPNIQANILCLQVLNSSFEHLANCRCLISELAPTVLATLQHFTEKPISAPNGSLLQQLSKCCENFLKVIPVQKCIPMLLFSSYHMAKIAIVCGQHETVKQVAVSFLVNVSEKYSFYFSQIQENCQDLKTVISQLDLDNSMHEVSLDGKYEKNRPAVEPLITLKTDFSNFN